MYSVTRPSLALFALLAWLPTLPGQATVFQILAANGSEVTETDDVEFRRFGARRAEAVLRKDDTLGVDDELLSKTGNTTVVLQCADTTITFQGKFRIAILAGSENRPCVINLLEGDVHLMGGTPTGVQAERVGLGALRTHFAVSVSRGDGGVRRDVRVFEGAVEILRVDRERPIIEAGGAAVFDQEQVKPERITKEQYEMEVALLTRIDVSRVAPENRGTASERISAAYRRVLAKPDDPQLRLDLVSEQLRFDAASPRTLYHVDRARLRSVPIDTADLAPRVEALAAATYLKLGQVDLAAARIVALQGFPAPAVERVLAADGLREQLVSRVAPPPVTVPTGSGVATQFVRALQVEITHTPATFARGKDLHLVVRVTDGAATPVAGAVVTLATDGGGFAGGGISITGATDANGQFATTWRCAKCAANYGFRASAVLEGFRDGAAELNVGIRLVPINQPP